MKKAGNRKRLLNKILITVLLTLLLFNCKSINYLYSGMEQVRIGHSNNNFSYMYPVSRKPNNNTVIIIIGGSGYSSVLGSRMGGFSTGYSTAGILNIRLAKEYDLLILEKPNLEPFENEESKKELLQIYTVEELSTIYARAIDYFFTIRKYDKAVIFGHSEGGRLVPAIYNRLSVKEKISRLVIAGAGGISQEEQLKILIERGIIEDLTPADFSKKCIEINKNPDSVVLSWWGHPYRRWASFLNYRYIEDLENIQIPVLLVHGRNDNSSPVEGSRIVFNDYNKNGNISYIETDGGHGAVFNNLEMVEAWIENKHVENKACCE